MSLTSHLIIICLSIVLTSNIYGQDEEGKDFDELPVHMDCKDILDKNDRNSCSNNKLISFIIENLKYPKSAQESEKEGTVVASFVVKTDGSMDKMKIVKGLSKECDDEVLRVLKAMNSGAFKWYPGSKDKKAVNVEMKLPVQFRLPKK